MNNNTQQTSSSNNKTEGFSRKRLIFLIVFLVAAIIVGGLWWHNNSLYISSDDANIDSYRIDISSIIDGQISGIYVEEGQTVSQGTPLFKVRHLSETQSENNKLEFSEYIVHAPVEGVIGKRWSLTGDIVSIGQTIITLNEKRPMWISVFLEESKYQYIRLNQKAMFKLDAYPQLNFYGKIFYIGSNTASEFALIPPNNAAGNYTKVSQRIPIKISIEKIEGNEQIKKQIRLVSGMSASVKIRKADK